MIVSQTAVYALRAVLYLADAGPEERARVDDIAAALHVPRNYLSKVLHVLARAGVLSSIRGPHGGFRLRGSPSKLTLQRVVAPFDEAIGKSSCMLGRARCSDAAPCPVHDRYKAISSAVQTLFQQTTVQDLSNHPTALEVALQ